MKKIAFVLLFIFLLGGLAYSETAKRALYDVETGEILSAGYSNFKSQIDSNPELRQTVIHPELEHRNKEDLIVKNGRVVIRNADEIKELKRKYEAKELKKLLVERQMNLWTIEEITSNTGINYDEERSLLIQETENLTKRLKELE